MKQIENIEEINTLLKNYPYKVSLKNSENEDEIREELNLKICVQLHPGSYRNQLSFFMNDDESICFYKFMSGWTVERATLGFKNKIKSNEIKNKRKK